MQLNTKEKFKKYLIISNNMKKTLVSILMAGSLLFGCSSNDKKDYKIAFTKEIDRKFKIYTMNADGSEEKE